MMVQSEVLKACAHCGKSEVLVSRAKAGVEWWAVDCDAESGDGCGLNIMRSTKAAAITAWNTRTPAVAADEGVVEVVALAMAKEIGWGTFSHFDPDDMRRVARAAISAMAHRP